MIKEAIGLGNTIVLAQKNACEILGVSDGKVVFEVIQTPKSKIFGLFGGKPAKVRAFLSVDPAEHAAEYLNDVLEAFGVKGFKIDVNKTDGGAELLVKGGDANHAIGRRGDTLDAIQYLTCLVANEGMEDYYRVTVNIEDYRERREKTLADLGKKLAYRALKTGEKIKLEPMTPYERKIIHLAIEQVEGVESYSEGETLKRHVIISPKDGEVKANFKNKFDKFKKSDKVNYSKENTGSLYSRYN